MTDLKPRSIHLPTGLHAHDVITQEQFYFQGQLESRSRRPSKQCKNKNSNGIVTR